MYDNGFLLLQNLLVMIDMEPFGVYEWQCPSCTLINKPSRFKCHVCGTPKGTSTRQSKCVITKPLNFVCINASLFEENFQGNTQMTDPSPNQNGDNVLYANKFS